MKKSQGDIIFYIVMSEYSLVAGTYDLLLTPFLLGMRKQVLAIADSLKPDKIIDLCCGTGHQLKMLRKNGHENVNCVDLSSEMLHVAAKGRYAPACHLKDASDTSFESNSYDMAVISLALHEKTPEKASAVINEAYRILKPGAGLVISDYETADSVPRYADAAIRFIEFLVGGEHFANYKNYMNSGGIYSLIDSKKFNPAGTFHTAAGGISVKLWTVIK